MTDTPLGGTAAGDAMHPRPHLVRDRWLSLDGPWDFRFGEGDWGATIQVPFPWESPASGVGPPSPDRYVRGADVAAGRAGGVGWYRRRVTIPPDWAGESVWVVVGAAYWSSRVWVDGRLVAEHDDGYLPFDAEVTAAAQPGAEHELLIRVEAPEGTDEYPHGKNTRHWYSRASGIWQPVFLEPRSAGHVRAMRTLVDGSTGVVDVRVDVASQEALQATLRLELGPAGRPSAERVLPVELAPGISRHRAELIVPDAPRWSPEHPVLHDLRLTLETPGQRPDVVRTAVGFRTIDFRPIHTGGPRWLHLDGEPRYVRAVMTQGYHPDGILAYPDEATIRHDLETAKALGFDMVRAHVKVEDPRYLALADRLGLLVWSEVPDFLAGTPEARTRWERTWRGMIERDSGHPSIVLWCMFIESWGLGTDQFGFGRADRPFAESPDVQAWVSTMYRLGRDLDHTRPILENSVSEADHTCAEVNDTHLFPTGYGELQAVAAATLDEYVAGAYPGSTHNFAPGWTQADQPLMVTSMAGWSSVGGVETSWPMRVLVNEVRARERIAGYGWVQLYDVEWELTGLETYDRRAKDFGYDVATLHAPDVLVVRGPLARAVPTGEALGIDVALAHGSGEVAGTVRVRASLEALDESGRRVVGPPVTGEGTAVDRRGVVPLAPVSVPLPDAPVAGRVVLEALDEDGWVVARGLVVVASVPESAAGLEDWQGDGEAVTRTVGSTVQQLEASAIATTLDLAAPRARVSLEAELAVRVGHAAQTLADQPTATVRVSLDDRPVAAVAVPHVRADTGGALSIVEPVGEGAHGAWVAIDLGVMTEAGSHTLRLEADDDARVVLFGPRLGSVPSGPRLRSVT